MIAVCNNLLELPKDILQKIQLLLGKQKYIFLYVILSCKKSDEFCGLLEKGSPLLDNKKIRQDWNIVTASPLLNIIHNTVTYVGLYIETLQWRNDLTIPSDKQFKKCYDSIFSNNLENKFEMLQEIADYLSSSYNKSSTDSLAIIWNGKKIGTKKRYAKYFNPNTFWRDSLRNLKLGKFRVCGCTPFCWRCKREYNIFNVKQGDKLVVKSQENKRHYICDVKITKFENTYYPSVRDIYRRYFQDKKGWENIWETELCPKIEIFVELLPLPHQPVLNKTFQFISGADKFYYMAYCYTSLLAWEKLDNAYYNPRKMRIDKVYNLPYGWVLCAKKDAKTALALV